MSQKVALITGITGQDGAYLAQLLLDKGYEVHGIKRRSSSFNTGRIDHIYEDRHEPDTRLFLHFADMTDSLSLLTVIRKVKPTEIYNLAAQSHVHVSFETPEYTANCDALGTLRILEAIRILQMENITRFYQASTSELFGNSNEHPQSEITPFNPRSPYAVAKLYAYWITKNYREAYGIHACNGILFNHESPLRGETFVTRKITRAVAAIMMGQQHTLYLGNLDASRDWGHARDYVRGMWQILQKDSPEDYVLATGDTYTVRQFVERAFKCVGRSIRWEGAGEAEQGVCTDDGTILIKVSAEYYRPLEVDFLIGDASRAQKELGWKPQVTFDEMVDEMVEADLAELRIKNNAPKINLSHVS